MRNLCRTAHFSVDLKKMLIAESKAAKKSEREAITFGDYAQALKDKEHQSSIAWILREMDEYAKTGRWL